MRLRMMAIGAAAVGAFVFGMRGLGAQHVPYQKTGEIHIGGQGGFDYLAVDPASHRLYVSNSTQVVVIDVNKNAVVGTIADTPGVHGIAFVPGGKGFTSNGREGKASIVDLTTLKTLKKVDVGPGPDAIMYEPKMHEVYAMNHSAGTVTVVSADTGAMVATIKLSGEGAETAQDDPAIGRVFVNIEDSSVIDVIDVATHKVVATWPVAPAEGPTGMAIDTATHRIFVGGGPDTVMIDDQTGKVVAQMPICSGTDATFFDPETKYVFSSCGDGRMTIGHEDSPSALTVVQTLTTTARARTMALDPTTHKILRRRSGLPGRGGRRAGARPRTSRRPPARAGLVQSAHLQSEQLEH